ncbi:hypothetical protein BJI64_08355 [Acinetobacter baumannii]|nr:hypothetical protein BJI64_08355 [Acinetobacter baumannii]
MRFFIPSSNRHKNITCLSPFRFISSSHLNRLEKTNAKTFNFINYIFSTQTWAIETNSVEKELVWDMSEFGGWYDFTVTLADDATFSRRFAGRIETQEDSISDPYMGYLES